MTAPVPRIRIIAPPPGEAPLEIRQAWVGMLLPVPPGRAGRPRSWRVFGVLTGPRNWWKELIRILKGESRNEPGYAVNAREAVTLLEAKDPAAAAWWRSNTPHVMTGSRYFVFAAEVCEEVPPAV